MHLPLTFSALLFTFLLLLLSLVQHRRSFSSLLQLAHEGLNFVETVIKDPLRKEELPSLREKQPKVATKDSKEMSWLTTSLSARRKEISGPPFAVVK